jgi:hypothetical protein
MADVGCGELANRIDADDEAAPQAGNEPPINAGVGLRRAASLVFRIEGRASAPNPTYALCAFASLREISFSGARA